MTIAVCILCMMLVILGGAMIDLARWCIVDTYRSRDRTVDKILYYMLYGCGLVMGIIDIILGGWLIASFLQCL